MDSSAQPSRAACLGVLLRLIIAAVSSGLDLLTRLSGADISGSASSVAALCSCVTGSAAVVVQTLQSEAGLALTRLRAPRDAGANVPHMHVRVHVVPDRFLKGA